MDDPLHPRCEAVGKFVSKLLTGSEKRVRGGMDRFKPSRFEELWYHKLYYEGGKVVIKMDPKTRKVVSIYGIFCREKLEDEDAVLRLEGKEAQDLWDSVL